MDSETLAAYQRDYLDFAEDWHTQPTPLDLHEVVGKFFEPGPTADIGCGAGRDTAWLTENGYPAVGFDPSSGLIAEAKRRHLGIEFRQGSLPELDGVESQTFQNVLCETVIMHLPAPAVTEAVHKLLEILVPGGVLYLSWRATTDSDRRDEHGRLYSAFDTKLVLDALDGAELLLNEEKTSKKVHRVAARKL